MIAKGNPHNSGPYLAWYLAAADKGDERSELGELRGFASDNIFDAFSLGQLMADGTRCEKPFFHVQVRTPKGEDLTREQWRKVTDRIERRLGFEEQPRAVIFHQKDGHEHMHLVWFRIGVDDNHAIDPGLYKKKLKEVCRKLEKEMGLTIVRNERDPDEKTQSAARPEFEQSRRLKTDLNAIREDIRACWDMSDNGRSFAAALNEHGFILARGDRRAFVILDEMGGYHALSKRITGVAVKETLSRMADLDASSLPSVAEAKAIQREKMQREEEEAKAMSEPKGVDEEEQKKEAAQREEEEKQAAIQKDEEQKQQAIREEEERKQEAIGKEEEAKQEALKEAAQKEEEQRRAQFKEQADRQAEQAKEMERQQARLDAYKDEIARMAEEARRYEERQRQAQEEARAKEGAIRNAGSRYGQALAQHYDVKDPYGSLARSAMAEYGAFLRDREALDRQIAQAKDSRTREALELRKKIEAAEYMAITSRRIAGQSAVVHGKLNPKTRRLESEESIKETARAEGFEKEAQELRQQFRELQEARTMEKSEKTERRPSSAEKAREPEPARKATPEKPRSDPEAQKKAEPRELMVEERQPGKPRGKAQSLGGFVQNLPETPNQPERKATPAEIRQNPTLRRAHYARLVAEQQRGEAIEHIGEDIKAGRNLNASDVRHLNREDLKKIRNKGDDGMKEIVRQHERHREQERER